MDLAAFDRELTTWREQRHADLTAPAGWTALIGLHWIGPGAHYLGSDADNGIRLARGPAHLGMIELDPDGGLRFVPESGVAITLDGVPLQKATALRSDEHADGASRIGFDDGRGVAIVIVRSGRHALRVRHADAETRTGFRGLDFWPADPAWRIEGRFVAHPAGKTIHVANIIGGTDEVPNPGAIEFERDGRTHRLEAVDEGGEGLFLVFADRTSGQGSFGAGRFLDVPRPDARGRLTLDFNRAYNPPCAFTPFGTCPLPPPENRLDLRIEAGEQAYRAARTAP